MSLALRRGLCAVAFTLFATHYFELTELAVKFKEVANVHFDAVEHKDHIVFLHSVEEGPANQSYGLQVAQLAGVPSTVIRAARRSRRLRSRRWCSPSPRAPRACAPPPPSPRRSSRPRARTCAASCAPWPSGRSRRRLRTPAPSRPSRPRAGRPRRSLPGPPPSAPRPRRRRT